MRVRESRAGRRAEDNRSLSRRCRAAVIFMVSGAVALGAVIGTTTPLRSAAAAANPGSAASGVRFELNAGQSDGAVRFIARGAGYPFYLTATDAVMVLTQPPPSPSPPAKPATKGRPTPQKVTVTGAAVHLRPEGTESNVQVTGEGLLPGTSNYLVGKDRSKWHTNVPNYSAVRYHGIYPGIDLVFHASASGSVEYDFELAAGAKPEAIAVNVIGANHVQADTHGTLTIASAGGSVTEPKPAIYQQVNGARREISGGFTSLGGNRFGFSVGPHDSTKPLVIDPAVVYSTYLGGDLGVSSAGGSGNDGNGVAADASGSAYVTGRTFAPDFPTTPGAFQTSYFVNPNGLNPDPSVVGTYSNAFISKLTPDGSGLVYSTYLGGSGGGSFSEGDVGRKVKLDAAGDAYVVGTTDSPDFPTTSTALVPSQPGGPGDIFTGFLSKLSNDGSQLLYSTYLNGFANDLAVEASGRAVLTGSASPGFTTTANTYQATCRVCSDFTDGVATSGSTTFTSATANFTYLDAGSGIYDPTGTIFPCCGTHIASVTDAHTVVLDSAPTTGGTTSFTVQARRADLGWVGEIDPNVAGSAGLVYSSLVGADYGSSSFSGLAIDASGKIVVAGTTSGLNFPTTSGAAQGGCRSDCPFNHDGVTTNASTTFTSAGAQFDVNVDAGEIIQSPNLPAGTTIASVVSPTQVTLSAAATASGSTQDFFIPSRQIRFDWIDREYRTGIVAKLDPAVAGTPSLVYSTYLGGSGIAIDFAGGDVPQGVAVDAAGNAYVTGSTGSPDFPTTSGVFSSTCNVTPGAACRGLVTFHDGVTTAGSTTFTSASADFIAQDARRNLFSTDIFGPGNSFAYPAVVDNATTIELNAPAAASATGVTFTLVRAPVTDAFVTKLNASGTSFIYSTFLGGSGSDGGAGIAVDASGRASVMGSVGSTDFPLRDPVAPYAPHGAFITQLTPDASSHVYSTTIGGNGGDAATGIAVDPAGATYVVGLTSSTNFPTTPGALKTQTKKSNAFVIKIAAVGSSVPIATGVQPASGPLGGGNTVTITGHGFSGATAVHFGSVAAVFSVQSDTQIVATSPAQSAYGVELVTVTTPGGTSPANPIDSFTYTEGQWSATQSIPMAREGASATVLKNGKVLIAGGTGAAGAINDCELYDPVSGTWSSAAPLNQARFSHTATLLGDGRVLVVGGTTGGTDSLDSVEIYDPVANSWTTAAPLALARISHSATLLPGGQVLVAGGFSFGAPSGDLTLTSATLYDPSANTWTEVGALPIGTWDHSATLLASGKVLIAGGSQRFAAQAASYLYDPLRRIFETTGSLGAPRLAHTATLLPNGKVLVTGGSGDPRSPALNTEETYDPASGTWTLVGIMFAGRTGGTATLLDNGKVLIAGGATAVSRGNALSSAELFDPSTSIESHIADMSVARGGSTDFGIGLSPFTATLLSTGPCGTNCGRVLVVGDSGDASAELYSPAPNVTGVSSTQQYSLNGSDGTTWQPIDATKLSQTVTPAVGSSAVMVGNADLWTSVAGFNQDLGIRVTPQGGSPTVVAWKESGGNGGTFSPNAAAVQGTLAMTAGTTYTVQLVWKTNKSMPSGEQIFAGAGGTGNFSPTTLTTSLYPSTAGAVQQAVSTQQFMLNGSDGSTWQTQDSNGHTLPSWTVTPASTTDALLSGNADLWTENAGFNQDIGIQVTPPCNGAASTIAAWKESGGSAGTFSPNAAFVQAVCPMTGGTQYTAQLVWKANRAMPSGNRIAAGAGSPGNFSPTSLFGVLASSANVTSAVSTQQYVTTSDGTTWQHVDDAVFNPQVAPPGPCAAVITGNADLWTMNAGYNQDLGIMVNGTVIAWKESGGFAGTFSPNAAYVQALYPVTTTTPFRVTLVWKSNIAMASGTHIAMGAGPWPSGSATFSPTSLTVDLRC